MAISEIKHLISQADREISGEKARRFLRSAADLCARDDSLEASLLLARVQGLLAMEEANANKRAGYWRKSMQTLREQTQIDSELKPLAIDTYAMLAVDCFQDRFANIASSDRQQILRNSLKLINGALLTRDAYFGQLLSRKAAILRHLALTEVSPKTQLTRLQQAKRCSELSYKQAGTFGASLELGLCE
jgi:hypothetical protein